MYNDEIIEKLQKALSDKNIPEVKNLNQLDDQKAQLINQALTTCNVMCAKHNNQKALVFSIQQKEFIC